jgi:hypothetical protein
LQKTLEVKSLCVEARERASAKKSHFEDFTSELQMGKIASSVNFPEAWTFLTVAVHCDSVKVVSDRLSATSDAEITARLGEQAAARITRKCHFIADHEI